MSIGQGGHTAAESQARIQSYGISSDYYAVATSASTLVQGRVHGMDSGAPRAIPINRCGLFTIMDAYWIY